MWMGGWRWWWLWKGGCIIRAFHTNQSIDDTRDPPPSLFHINLSITAQSKAPAGFEEAVAAAATTKKRERRTRVRAREEKYWAEKKDKKGEGGPEQEVPEAEAEAGDGEGDAAAVALEEAAGAVSGGILSAALLERVARAKEAERARKVHEALAVVELAR